MSRHVRLYRRFLRLYPASFRDGYAGEMTVLFSDQLRDARRSGKRSAVARLWARSLADLVATVPMQHVREARAVPQTVEPALVDMAARRGPSRPLVALAAVPIIAWTVLSRMVPGFTDPLYQNPPGILGLPAGIVMMFVAAVLTILGLTVAIKSRSMTVIVLGLILFTIPAVLIIALGPPVLLMIQGLAV